MTLKEQDFTTWEYRKTEDGCGFRQFTQACMETRKGERGQQREQATGLGHSKGAAKGQSDARVQGDTDTETPEASDSAGWEDEGLFHQAQHTVLALRNQKVTVSSWPAQQGLK